LTVFVLADCIVKGDCFLLAIHAETAAICAERVWLMPSFDKRRTCFEGVRIDNDLISAMTAWTLATADAMLGDRLNLTTRLAIRDKIRHTVVDPFLENTRGQRPPEWWFRDQYNWNVVVHAGIVGAALLLADDYTVEERAELIAACETALPFYLSGWPSDGYCVESIGYWRYGFGHFALLAEAVLAATGGKLSLYPSESARVVAQLPKRLEMIRSTHFYPPFADGRFVEPPGLWLEHILAVRYGLQDVRNCPVPVPEGEFTLGFFSTFLHAWGVILGFNPDLAPAWTGSGQKWPSGGLYDWFNESCIYVGRQNEREDTLSVAFKGGANGVRHGHNDLGSFLVAVGKIPLIVDPGLTVYSAKTFGPNRFQHQILGSYGHPVPLVAGTWQGTLSFLTITVFNDPPAKLYLFQRLSSHGRKFLYKVHCNIQRDLFYKSRFRQQSFSFVSQAA
jgi:hypothetical protein